MKERPLSAPTIAPVTSHTGASTVSNTHASPYTEIVTARRRAVPAFRGCVSPAPRGLTFVARPRPRWT